MTERDIEAAKQYAFSRLEDELAPDLYYHNYAHTRDDVLPAAMRLADLSGIEGEEAQLLAVAAAFHDIGYVIQRDEHEQASCQLASQALPQFGFTEHQIEQIMSIIMATRLPQTPTTLLEEIMADADLDVLGRTEDFFEINLALRAELAAYGQPTPLKQWYKTQLDFIEKHIYFTEAAHSLRDTGKQQNIEAMKKRLNQL